MTQNDPRLMLMALELLRQQLAENTAAILANSQQQEEANREAKMSKVVGGSYRTRLDDLLGAHVEGANAISYDENGNIRGPHDRHSRSIGEKSGSGFGRETGRAVGEHVGKQLAGVGKFLALRFAAVMAPLAVMAQILSANTSGFQVFTSTMKLFAATIAPILLPVLAVMSAGLLYLSEIIWQDIAPELEGFYGIIVGTFLPAIEILVDGLKWAHDQITDALESLNPFSSSEEAAAAPTGDGTFDGTGAGGAFDEKTGAIGALTGGSGPASGSGGKPSIRDAFSDVVREMRMSFGPHAQFSGLSQISKNAQLAALNQSPFEAKLLERMNTAISALERVVANTKKSGPVV